MAKKKVKTRNAEGPSFEEVLARLEAIVHELEEGEIGLEEALGRYEEGVKLLRHCYDWLGRAERRIELLDGVDAQGNPTTTRLEDGPPNDVNEPAQRDNDVDASDGLF